MLKNVERKYFCKNMYLVSIMFNETNTHQIEF